MSLREDFNEVKKEVETLEEKSLAMSLLSDYKKQNKRQFITIIIILTLWFSTMAYLVYVLNDINVATEETTTQEIKDFDNINGNIINKGHH